MELSDVILQNLFGFGAALIGGLIAGFFTMRAADKGRRFEIEKEQQHDEREVQNLLDAIGVELGTLWGFHMRRIGAMIENLQDGQALEFYYPLTQDYFTVYNSNAGKIGQVKDAVLREAVVVCYNKCKKVVDGFKYNNELYRDWRDHVDESLGQDKARSDAKFRLLAEYAMMMKEDHFELKSYVERLITLLENRSKII